MKTFQSITIPQFDTSKGGLNFVSNVIYVFSAFIALFGIYGAFSGNIDGMGFLDGVLVFAVGIVFALLGFLFMKLGVDNSNVVFYSSKIELISKKGVVKKSFSKYDIQSISAYELIPRRPAPVILHIPFEALETAESMLNTYAIYIETQQSKESQKNPDFRSEKSLFIHNNAEAVAWIKKYFSEKIKSPSITE